MKVSKPKYATLVGAQLLAMPPYIELTLEYAALRGFQTENFARRVHRSVGHTDEWATCPEGSLETVVETLRVAPSEGNFGTFPAPNLSPRRPLAGLVPGRWTTQQCGPLSGELFYRNFPITSHPRPISCAFLNISRSTTCHPDPLER